MSNSPKSRGLGRGLSALMADVTQGEPTSNSASTTSDRVVPIELVEPNPDQPRRHFAEEALSELAESIAEKGIIQPIVVRPSPRTNGGFEIVAGERRWRAAQRAKLHQVPVIIREFNDTEVLEVAIIENIQRADLSAIDEAAGYKQLMKRFGHTQDQVATALGKSRSHIANLMRLLTLPDTVQNFVTEGKISAGHARALVGREDAEKLSQEIISRGLSVRDVENLVKAESKKDGGQTARRVPAEKKDADTIQIEKELSAQLRMPIQINHDSGKESGKLVLNYRDLGQLDDLLRLLSGD